MVTETTEQMTAILHNMVGVLIGMLFGPVMTYIGLNVLRNPDRSLEDIPGGWVVDLVVRLSWYGSVRFWGQMFLIVGILGDGVAVVALAEALGLLAS